MFKGVSYALFGSIFFFESIIYSEVTTRKKKSVRIPDRTGKHCAAIHRHFFFKSLKNAMKWNLEIISAIFT